MPEQPNTSQIKPAPAHRWHWARLLLLLPFAAMLWVPSYNRVEPRLWSFPFFYWYQLLRIVLSGVIVFAIYVVEHRPPR